MDNVTKLLLQGTAGGAAGDGEFVDNLFAAHFYTGVPGGSATVNTGIDLSGSNEGMIWVKNRSAGSLQLLYDTIRGGGNAISPDRDSAQSSQSDGPATFTSNGFTTGSAPSYQHISWTFKSQEKFFDVVTYTGNGSSSGQEVSHSLGSVPGCVVVKCLQDNNAHSKSNYWIVYHRSLTDQHFVYLNSNEDEDGAGWFQQSDVTDTYVRVPKSGGNTNQINTMNRNGYSYVMYLFAHDEAVFGYKGNNSIIKCDSYTGNGSSNGPDINLGWEPQWLLVKRSSGAEDWMLFDHMRTSGRQDMWLDDQRPNLTTADGDGAGSDSQPYLNWTSTGFKLSSNTTHTNGNGDKYIYIAVRRPDGAVGKLPTAGSQVFTPVADSSGEPMFKTPNHYVDMSLQKNSDYATQAKDWNVVNRLRTGQRLHTDSSSAEDYNTYQQFDFQNGMSSYGIGSGIRFSWNWKRYAGFDMVHYTGSNSTRSLAHSLNRVPELIIIKKLNTAGNWIVGNPYLTNWNYVLYLNMINAQDNASSTHFSSAPTSTHINLGNHGNVNGATWIKYLALLFASVDGISKVGSYTGTGYDLTVTTGFSPRFVLIKRTDSDENWFVLDTVRGWASGNDQYLILNSTAQQASADFGNPVATGFLVKGTSSGSNTSGGTYIYYAHA